jgi:hypothetical protein
MAPLYRTILNAFFYTPFFNYLLSANCDAAFRYIIDLSGFERDLSI